MRAGEIGRGSIRYAANHEMDGHVGRLVACEHLDQRPRRPWSDSLRDVTGPHAAKGGWVGAKGPAIARCFVVKDSCSRLGKGGQAGEDHSGTGQGVEPHQVWGAACRLSPRRTGHRACCWRGHGAGYKQYKQYKDQSKDPCRQPGILVAAGRGPAGQNGAAKRWL